jgi:hypothetical protein
MYILLLYFPQTVSSRLVFSFSTVSFIEQKFLILMRSSLSELSFVDPALGAGSEKSSPNPRLSRFSVSFCSFMVLHFTCRHIDL